MPAKNCCADPDAAPEGEGQAHRIYQANSLMVSGCRAPAHGLTAPRLTAPRPTASPRLKPASYTDSTRAQ